MRVWPGGAARRSCALGGVECHTKTGAEGLHPEGCRAARAPGAVACGGDGVAGKGQSTAGGQEEQRTAEENAQRTDGADLEAIGSWKEEKLLHPILYMP